MPKSKCWWTKELTQLRACANKLERSTYNLREDQNHRIHREHKEAKSKYYNMLKVTKQQHWRDWLEKAKDLDIWTAHHLISAPPTDRGKAKIPKLKYKKGKEDAIASTNEEKSAALAKCFFPTKPQVQDENEVVKYPKACKGVGKITREQIHEQLRRIKPFKAPGLDSIPNIALSNCADLIINRLYYIYNTMLERGLQYGP